LAAYGLDLFEVIDVMASVVCRDVTHGLDSAFCMDAKHAPLLSGQRPQQGEIRLA
jgi:hypothetical protein